MRSARGAALQPVRTLGMRRRRYRDARAPSQKRLFSQPHEKSHACSESKRHPHAPSLNQVTLATPKAALVRQGAKSLALLCPPTNTYELN